MIILRGSDCGANTHLYFHSYNHIRAQRGVALITVLLIVALAAILATQMNARLMLQMQRTTNIGLNQQAYWYAMGAEAFVKRVLLDVSKKEPDSTNLSQLWAQGEMSFPVESGAITGEITDLQACFNLNALRVDKNDKGNSRNNNASKRNSIRNNSPQQGGNKNNTKQSSKDKSNNLAKTALVELITNLDVEGISQFEAEYMVDALSDWLDEDTVIASAGGAEDNDYAAKEFAYLAANNYLASVNELRLIEHFTVPVIAAMRDYVCVLPNSNLFKINVNTLKTEQALLLQVSLGISLADAEQVLSSRDDKGFKTIDDFFKAPELARIKLSSDKKQHFVVDSEYFQLKTTASFNDSYFSLISIMQVIDNKKVEVLSRTISR